MKAITDIGDHEDDADDDDIVNNYDDGHAAAAAATVVVVAAAANDDDNDFFYPNNLLDSKIKTMLVLYNCYSGNCSNCCANKTLLFYIMYVPCVAAGCGSITNEHRYNIY